MSTKVLGTLASLLMAAYAASFWIDVDVWGTRVILDDSFKYALTKMRTDGLFLGKDVFFSLGPLAQYLGPLIEKGQAPNIAYVFVGLFFVGSLFFASRTIIASFVPLSILGVFFLAFFLIQFPGIFWHQVPDIGYYFLTFCLFLAASLISDVKRLKLFLLLLMMNGAITLLIKLSFGVHAVAIFAVMLVCHRRKIGSQFFVLVTAGFVALSCVTFRWLTGSWGIYLYLVDGFVHVARFSETMAFHFPADESGLGYWCGLILCADLVLAIGILCFSPVVPRESRAGLLVCTLYSVFVIYKVGFVRYDVNHAYPVYLLLLEAILLVCVILAAVARTWYPHRAAVVLIFAVAIGTVHAGLAPLNATLAESVRTNIRKWGSAPQHLVDGVRLFTHGFAGEREKKGILLSRHPNLFPALNSLSTSSASVSPRMTVLPWELMFAQVAERFSFSPIPFLQLYLESCHRDGRAATEAYLTGPRRPDVIVLGAQAIDGRNPVTELTNWLVPLHMKYRPLAKADGYTILGMRSSEKRNPALVCDKRPPGIFLKIKVKPLGLADGLLWTLGKILFKAPAYDVHLVFRDGNGTIRRLRWRGYRAQLEQGAYGAVMPPGELLEVLERRNRIRPQHVIAQVLEAQLLRRSGYYNLPIGPDQSPLSVEYCRTEDLRTQ